MNDELEPDATWPGVLFLEVPEQGVVLGELRNLAGLSDFDKRDLASRVLPARIRSSKAERFAWVMPAYRHDVEPAVECLVVVMGEVGRTEAHVADVVRGPEGPSLAPWREPSRRVDGLFAVPLSRALLARPRPKKRRSARVRTRVPSVSPAGRPLLANCPDCSAGLAEPHRPGCDIEQCSVCLGQRLICGCFGHDPLAAVWEGEWPGAAACRQLGWWAVRTDAGWRPCAVGTPGAMEDLNRLAFFRETGVDCLYETTD